MKFNPGGNFENKENVPIVETVRTAILYRGKFLLLEKSADSKNPGALEFPGGKIDDMDGPRSTVDEQVASAIREAEEETHIDVSGLPLEKVESFENYFESTGKDGKVKKFKRLIHLYLIRLPDDREVSLKVNETVNEKGQSEDNHQGYKWVSPSELVDSAVSLKENPVTGKSFHPLSRNSRYIKKLLTTTEYLNERAG